MTHTSVGAGERHTWGLAQSMRPVALPPASLLPLYLKPRHSRGAWWSRNTRRTLKERRNHQTQKKVLPHRWGRRR